MTPLEMVRELDRLLLAARDEDTLEAWVAYRVARDRADAIFGFERARDAADRRRSDAA